MAKELSGTVKEILLVNALIRFRQGADLCTVAEHARQALTAICSYGC